MKKPLIFLADLRQNYLGVMSLDGMPLGIGYQKAVMDRDLPEVESVLFAYPEELALALAERPPDALLLSNYMWNEALGLHFSARLRQQNPNALIIMGGPNFPVEQERQFAWMEQNHWIDLYATGEGDFWTTDVLKMWLDQGMDRHALRREHIPSAFYKKGGDAYISTPIEPRRRHLDDIPSPFLSGVMDKFFDGKLAPLWETNRGCPFTCTFCVQGTKWYTKVNYFSLERLQEEIHYIGAKIRERSPQQKFLRIADPNYGMFKRDIQISEWLGEAQAQYRWPLLIDATTGKNQAQTILKSLEKVNGALFMYQAVQSMDEDVLENIKRKNIKLDAYRDIQAYVAERGLKSSSDLILGLPGDSLKSHLQSLEKLINSGTNKLNNFQAMLLKGSELEMPAEREKYGFESRFRILPKNFGDYDGERIIGTEEIIVSTDALSFADYLTGRTYHWVISVFWNQGRFDELVRFLEKQGIKPWDWLEAVGQNLKNVPAIRPLIDRFLAETKGELFESAEAVREFYQKDENWQRLLNNEIGDNLMYKYRALGSFLHWEGVVECAFLAAKSLLPEEETQSKIEFWEDFQHYLQLRFAHGPDREALLGSETTQLRYDLPAWLQDGQPATLDPYRFDQANTFNFHLSDENAANIRSALAVWDYDPATFSMFVKRIQVDWQERVVV